MCECDVTCGAEGEGGNQRRTAGHVVDRPQSSVLPARPGVRSIIPRQRPDLCKRRMRGYRTHRQVLLPRPSRPRQPCPACFQGDPRPFLARVLSSAPLATVLCPARASRRNRATRGDGRGHRGPICARLGRVFPWEPRQALSGAPQKCCSQSDGGFGRRGAGGGACVLSVSIREHFRLMEASFGWTIARMARVSRLLRLETQRPRDTQQHVRRQAGVARIDERRAVRRLGGRRAGAVLVWRMD